MQKISNSDLAILNKHTAFSKSKISQLNNPYQLKQDVLKPTLAPAKLAAVRRTRSHVPCSATNGLRSLEDTAKIYRIPSNREKCFQSLEENLTDAEKSNDAAICIGTSVTKPKPPSSITLRYNSTLLAKPRRISGTVASKRAKQEKRKEKDSINEISEPKKTYEANVLPSKVYNKSEVLSSLRKLSLIEPFLNSNRNGFSQEIKDFEANEKETCRPEEIINSQSTFSLQKNKNGSNPLDNMNNTTGYNTKTLQNAVVGNKVAGYCEKRINDVTEKSGGPITPLFSEDPFTNDVFYIIDSDDEQNSQKDYIRTKNSEPFVYSDTYNNKISETEKLYLRPQHSTPISIVASTNELPKPAHKRQSYLTQRQLSFVGSTLPTATVVDISTGSVIEKDVEKGRTDLTALVDDVQQLKKLAGLKTSVPSSFYYNQKTKRRKKDNKTEMIELSKLREKAQEDIRKLLSSAASDNSEANLAKDKPTVVKILDKRPIEFRIMRLPSPKRVEVEVNEAIRQNSSYDSDQSISRCSSTLTRSSSSSSVKYPCAPNPSPQLASNRFQIFPTTYPNTFHAYTSASSRPTIISMDHFSGARASLQDQRQEKLKTAPSAELNRKSTNGLGFRISLKGGNASQSKEFETLKNDTLVKGQSINLRNQTKSDSDNHIDNEVEFTDTNIPKSISDEIDEKNMLQAPPHAVNKFFKFCNASAGKVKFSKKNHEDFVYAPLQSLVIKSCQSFNPVDVIPECEQENRKRSAGTALPNRQHAVSGHLSPLKGIRILRRKVTIRHSDPERYKFLKNAGIKYIFNEEKQHFLDYDSDPNKEPVASNFKTNGMTRLGATAQDLNYLKDLSSKLGEDSKNIDVAPPLSYINVHAKEKISGNEFTDKSINIDKLCLGNPKMTPYLLLKEGSMQTLNFLNPNALQLTVGLTPQDAKEAVERSAKRRKKIQLGSNGGTDECVSVKIAAGGGFKSNVARYSLLLRQKYHKQQSESSHKNLQQEEILEISKAGIESVGRNDRRMQKPQSSLRDEENRILPSVNKATENSNLTSNSSAEFQPSKSQLHIQDILSNLCTDDLSSKPRSAIVNCRLSDECYQHQLNNDVFNRPPSLNDIYTDGRISSSASNLPDRNTTSYRLSKDISFNVETTNDNSDGINSLQEDFLKNAIRTSTESLSEQ